MTMPKLTIGQMGVLILQIGTDNPASFCTGYRREISDEGMLDLGIKIKKRKFLANYPKDRKGQLAKVLIFVKTDQSTWDSSTFYPQWY